MAILISKPPAKSTEALQNGLVRHRALLKIQQRIQKADSEFVLPHRVYFARLDQVKRGIGLQYARPVAWRYFVKSDVDESLVLAEVNIERKGIHRFASLHTVAHSQNHYELLKSIAQEASDRGEYAFRVLRIPSIYVLAVWLRSDRRGHDIVVPIVPHHHCLTNRHFYRRGEFEERIQSEARERPQSSLGSN
jgi:hypothetical protein